MQVGFERENISFFIYSLNTQLQCDTSHSCLSNLADGRNPTPQPNNPNIKLFDLGDVEREKGTHCKQRRNRKQLFHTVELKRPLLKAVPGKICATDNLDPLQCLILVDDRSLYTQ